MNIDYKKAAVSLPLSVLLAGAVYAGGFYMDKTYIRQDTYRQSQVDNRVYELRDKIRAPEAQANRDVRGLYAWEKNEIANWKIEIKRLGGTP